MEHQRSTTWGLEAFMISGKHQNPVILDEFRGNYVPRYKDILRSASNVGYQILTEPVSRGTMALWVAAYGALC